MPAPQQKQPKIHPWKAKGMLLRETLDDRREGRDEYFAVNGSDYAYHREGK